ncbi:MAG: hypothetical protein ACYCV0_20475 [Desulfitobacteriaceae bacterium]
MRLCVDYGEDKVLTAIGSLKSPELSVEQIRAFLTPVNTPEKIPPEIDIKVPKPQFDKYDALMNRGAAV